MTDMGDIVLVHFEGEPSFFARIEDIRPDPKPGWWMVRLLVLAVPLQDITWILRQAYINGETFTMDGKEIRMEKVEPLMEKTVDDKKAHEEPASNSPKVVSIFKGSK